MIKRLAVFAALVLFLSTFLTPAHALFDNEVDKAKDFIKAGMYPQAIEQLQKRINDKPTDAEAHYLLGTCYMHTGNYGATEERFKSAVRLKADYGYKIGGEFRQAGSAALSRGQVQQAQGLFAKAVQYQPDLKQEIASECQNTGSLALKQGNLDQAQGCFLIALNFDPDLRETIATETFNQGQLFFDQAKYDQADSHFSLASSFDPALKSKICEMYYNLGKKAPDNQCVPFYLRTKKYCGTYNKEIGDRLLAISKTQKTEKEIQEWRTKAANFVELPPDFKIYPPGTYTFSLKAGEMTDHWIMLPPGRKSTYHFESSDWQFKVLYDDGEEAAAWEDGSWPSKTTLKCKIIAVKDQPKIIMVVK